MVIYGIFPGMFKAAFFIIALLLGSVFSAPLTYAQKCDVALREVYTEAFHEDYQPLNCQDNIKNLLKSAMKEVPNFDSSKAHVLVFFHVPGRLTQINIHPTSERDMITGDARRGGWNFHVVLEYENQIYDLDIGPVPRVTSVWSYFHEMFIHEGAAKPKGFWAQTRAELKESWEVFLSRDGIPRTPRVPTNGIISSADLVRQMYVLDYTAQEYLEKGAKEVGRDFKSLMALSKHPIYLHTYLQRKWNETP